jgi:hypothetical protein
MLKLSFRVLMVLPMLLLMNGFAQEMPVILKAMYDEQQRSMKELKLEGHEAPFYISYDVNDLKTYYFSASGGALLQSGARPIRSKNMRILVGGYEFNDESLDNDIFTNAKPNEIDMPLEDDYEGIRRSLWVTTDAIYRSAAQHFKENQNTLKEGGKELKDLPHRTFAKVSLQQVNQLKKFPELDKTQYENLLRKLSELARQFPELYSSSVALNVIVGNRYYLNSEGTSAITPVSNVVLQVRAAKDHRMASNRERVFYFSSPENLPSQEQLSEIVKGYLSSVVAEKSELKVNEEYTGPILFTNEAVGEVLIALLFGRETLTASNDLDVDDKQRYENTNTLEERIGKNIVAEAMTVKAKPKLRSFQGVELMGSFEIDSEGVTPPDEITLIERGTLKTLLNDRSLTRPDQTSNGHADGPGVIEISFEGNQTHKALKQSLMALAKEEGYDYAYLVKKASFRGMNNNEVYRVDVNTGEEKRISDLRFAGLQLRILRKAKGSYQLIPLNFPLAGTNMVSIICPDALLLEDVQVVPGRTKDAEEGEAFFVEPPKK